MDLGAGIEPASTSAAVLGQLAGTPIYMAPELFDGQPPSIASDLYSVGASDVLPHDAEPSGRRGVSGQSEQPPTPGESADRCTMRDRDSTRDSSTLSTQLSTPSRHAALRVRAFFTGD